MPRATADKQYFNFVKGKVTEATGLTYPENSAKDLDNVDLFVKGSIERRLGVDFEASSSLSSFSFNAGEIEDYAITTHRWTSVNGNGNRNFLVVQIGTKLYFWDLSSTTLSSGYINTFDFSTYCLDQNKQVFEPLDSSSGKGRLFVVGKYMDPLIITYDESASKMIGAKVRIRIRDLKGVDDGLAVDARPTSLSVTHEYNLMNQGWSSSGETPSESAPDDIICPITGVNQTQCELISGTWDASGSPPYCVEMDVSVGSA